MNFRANTFLKVVSIFSLFIMGSCNHQKHISDGQSSANIALKNKYASILGVPSSQIENLKLYQFIDDWYGAPYKSAGKTKSGVDCSGFVSILYAEIYNKTIGGPSASIFESCEVVSEKNLKEGDLVFFKINSDKVSHVGIYLQNRHFVHASTHKGVIISSLDETYYTKYFFKGGRKN